MGESVTEKTVKLPTTQSSVTQYMKVFNVVNKHINDTK